MDQMTEFRVIFYDASRKIALGMFRQPLFRIIFFTAQIQRTVTLHQERPRAAVASFLHTRSRCPMLSTPQMLACFAFRATRALAFSSPIFLLPDKFVRIPLWVYGQVLTGVSLADTAPGSRRQRPVANDAFFNSRGYVRGGSTPPWMWFGYYEGCGNIISRVSAMPVCFSLGSVLL
jgi:hypothetical protein